MGIFRFLLASAVALGHGGITGWLSPYYAVQAFFVVSGFYMALIYPKYRGLPVTVFYTNRYSRLIVSYTIVAVASLVCSRLYLEANFPRSPLSTMPKLALFSNLSMFGADLVNFFGQSDWMLIPQGWSLGTELWFYLLVPFLGGCRTKVLLLLFLGSIGVRAILITSGAPFNPWQQRFFPAEIAFFLIGMLSHRFYLFAAPRLTRVHGGVALVLGCSLVAGLGHWPWANELSAARSFLLAGALFLLLPLIFFATRHSAIDRLIGEFSYPVYLWHLFVLVFVAGHMSASPLPIFRDVLLWSIVLSIPTVLLIEIPLEKWRNARLARAAGRDTASSRRAESVRCHVAGG